MGLKRGDARTGCCTGRAGLRVRGRRTALRLRPTLCCAGRQRRGERRKRRKVTPSSSECSFRGELAGGLRGRSRPSQASHGPPRTADLRRWFCHPAPTSSRRSFRRPAAGNSNVPRRSLFVCRACAPWRATMVTTAQKAPAHSLTITGALFRRLPTFSPPPLVPSNSASLLAA